MEKLSKRQKEVLNIIIKMIQENEYPPTIKELAEELGVASKNAAVKHLKMLERKGYIRWEKNTARGIKIVEHLGAMDKENEMSLPLVGSVTAGLPMLALENIERYLSVPRHLIRSNDKHFLLRVNGESMKDAGILNDDLVIVRSQNRADNKDIVVALIDGEATVKRLLFDFDGKYLKADNPEYPDIRPKGEWSVLGKVVGLIREHIV